MPIIKINAVGWWCMLVGIGLSCACVALMLRLNAPVFVPLPSPEDTDQITAQIIDASDTFGIPPVPEFRVPEKYFPVILAFLSPAVRYQGSFSFDILEKHWALGQIELKAKNGSATTIGLYDVGKNPMIFSVNGVLCQRGGDYKPNAVFSTGYESYAAEPYLLCAVLRAIHKAAATRTEPAELMGYVQKLKRSKGELPPEIWQDSNQ